MTNMNEFSKRAESAASPLNYAGGQHIGDTVTYITQSESVIIIQAVTSWLKYNLRSEKDDGGGSPQRHHHQVNIRHQVPVYGQYSNGIGGV